MGVLAQSGTTTTNLQHVGLSIVPSVPPAAQPAVQASSQIVTLSTAQHAVQPTVQSAQQNVQGSPAPTNSKSFERGKLEMEKKLADQRKRLDHYDIVLKSWS